jgi:hypothetical protein
MSRKGGNTDFILAFDRFLKRFGETLLHGRLLVIPKSKKVIYAIARVLAITQIAAFENHPKTLHLACPAGRGIRLRRRLNRTNPAQMPFIMLFLLCIFSHGILLFSA